MLSVTERHVVYTRRHHMLLHRPLRRLRRLLVIHSVESEPIKLLCVRIVRVAEMRMVTVDGYERTRRKECPIR